MRDGTTVEGRIEALAAGVLFLCVSLDDRRSFPVADVALIDRKRGASVLPAAELREARGVAHLLLLDGGSSLKGRLVAIKRGKGSGEDRPRTYIFRTFDGQERRYEQSEVARIYLGSRPFDLPGRATPVGRLTPRAIPSRAASVPAGDQVSTGVSLVQ